jgi:hypothetical protein
LPCFLVCLSPVSCLSYVANVSGLSSSCVLPVKCCQFLWIVFVLCLTCQMLPMSLDCLRPVSATLDRQDTGRRQSRDIGNIWQARHRTKTIQRHWQHLTDKTQDKDGLHDKNSESDFFFPSTKIRIFFSATLGIRIFFLEKKTSQIDQTLIQFCSVIKKYIADYRSVFPFSGQ